MKLHAKHRVKRAPVRRRFGHICWRNLLTAAAMMAAATAITACGSSSAAGAAGGGAGSGKGPLSVGVFDAFEGSEAFLGPAVEAQCYAAITQVNAAGGVLGRKLQCSASDSTSDPADAVPNAQKMIASTSNLVLIDGPGAEEPATDSILKPYHVIEYAYDATPAYDRQSNPLWFRWYPSDALAGVAEAVYLIKHGYTHAAGVFDTSQGAQTQVPNLVKTYRKLGGHLAINLALAPGATYRTEVARLLASKPDAIITELDSPQETSAFFSELSQLSHGKLPPIIATAGEVSSSTNWPELVTKAIGAAAAKGMVEISTGGALNGTGYAAFKHALLSAPEKIVNRKQYLGLQWFAQQSDSVLLDALAMDAAKSTKSTKVAPFIYQIANGQPGAVTVHTYAQGLKELNAGHKIHLVGAGGAAVLNHYHNLISPFTILRWTGGPAGWVPIKKDTIPAAELRKYTS